MTYYEVLEAMRSFNKKHDIKRKVDVKRNENGEVINMTGRVVLKDSFFSRKCSLDERTYVFNNYNKALTTGDLGYSIFASCPYDCDCLRIEYLNEEYVEKAEIISVVE